MQPQTPADQAIMQQLWRKAFTNDKPLKIDCKTPAQAIRFRFTMYNAVKVFRRGQREADSILAQALENCCLSIADDKKTVVIRKKVQGEVADAMLAALDGEIPLAAEDALAREGEARMAVRIQDAEDKKKVPSEAAAGYGARTR